MELQNWVDLNAKLNFYVKKALDLTTEELLDILEDYIQKDVYDMHSKWEASGKRTGEFKKSWERTKAQQTATNIIESQIYQNISAMRIDSAQMIHIDRDSLSQIINSGIGYRFGDFEGTARPFWDDFLNYVNTNLTSIFEKNCLAVGLPISASISIG
jgi:hypothetical protein